MRILFNIRRNLHLPHLLPLFEWFRSRMPEIETACSAPPYLPARDCMPGLGIDDAGRKALAERGLPFLPPERVAGWQPDVTILADADFAGINWGGIIVNVNHGLICKGTFYTKQAAVLRENGADLVCVPGSYHAGVLREVLRKPVIATGFAKFDPVGRGELTRDSARQELGLGSGDRVVLFAPTYNFELSAVPLVRDRVRRLTVDGTKLLIKLHGMSAPEWREMYHLLELLDENITFLESMDITPAIVAADVVISDVSSAFMEAIALDRPVVLVNNPLQRTFHHYDPNDIEYRWRDVGLEVSSAEEMIEAVRRSFVFPEEKAGRRRHYGPMLVGPIDGLATERAALAILQHVRERVSA